jgi:phage tail sheath protein FI
MAELLSAGVFIEEVPATTQVVGPVSTSNMAIVSWFSQGPSNVATLITNFDQQVKTFGGFDKRSFGTYNMAAFFSNGGRRSWVVRVTPSDAVVALSKIVSATTDQTLATGDGTTAAFTGTAGSSVLKDNNGASPIKPSTVNIRWRGKGTHQVAQATKKRDGTTALTCSTGVFPYEGRIDPAHIPAVDESLFCVVPSGDVVLSWLVATVATPVTIANPPTGSTIGTGTTAGGSVATLDFRTGFFSILMTVTDTPDNASPVIATYYPGTTTVAITDDGAGALTGAGLTGPGTINYATGAYSFTATVAPHNLSPLAASYSIYDWAITAISAGVWANNYSVQIAGSPNYYVTATATYSRFTLNVIFTDTFGNQNIQESYEDLVYDDPTSAFYFADIINEFSSYIRITEPGGNEAPLQLNGVGRSMVIAGGNDSDTGRLIQTTILNAPIAKRTLRISYTDSLGVARVITDDNQGNLVGDVDPSYTNVVNYTTGALDFKTIPVAGPTGIKGGTLVLAVYRSLPAETVHTETLGTGVTGYTAGTDGTFDSTHFGRSQFTDPSLAVNYHGLYALDRIDELMQVIVPDFAGDTVVTGDLLDYAATRAASSSGGDRFIVLTVPKGSSATQAVDYFRNKLGRFSNFAAMYWPWIKIADPLTNGRPLTIPSLGHVCGIYARTDVNRNVGKSPGGTVDGQLSFLLGLESIPTQGERDYVYPNQINPFISSPQTGNAVWGVRTIAIDSTWRYINARRLFMFVEKSVYNSTFWIVFENNGPALWTRIKAQVAGFLLALYNDGYFAGSTPDQAFFVVCDDTNNTAATIALGQVIVDVGIAPNKPAEFVRFRFQQKTVG